MSSTDSPSSPTRQSVHQFYHHAPQALGVDARKRFDRGAREALRGFGYAIRMMLSPHLRQPCPPDTAGIVAARFPAYRENNRDITRFCPRSGPLRRFSASKIKDLKQLPEAARTANLLCPNRENFRANNIDALC